MYAERGANPYNSLMCVPGQETIGDVHLSSHGATGFETDNKAKVEEDARKKAMKDLVQSWMDRLQLISLITTFFASVEAGMLQITTQNSGAPSSRWEQATNATFLGALVMHVNAAFLSFLAAFFLIRYRVKAAKREELKVEGIPYIQTPASSSSIDVEMITHKIAATLHTHRQTAPHPAPVIHATWHSNPNIVQIGPFHRQPPIHLLSRCHSLCIWMSVLGFALTLMGIVCFAWASQPRSVSIFTTLCMGLSVVAGSVILTTKRHDDHLLYARF